MKIIIVGAGIGGLVAALRLHHAGIDCQVYERSQRIRELGVGVNVLPHAIKELAAAGLLDRLDDAGVRPSELVYTHRLGQQIMRTACGIAAGFGYPQYSAHRGRLQGVLLRAVRERLGPDAVRTGHRLAGFDQDGTAVRARFVDPDGNALAPVHGDVLVGADGVHSTGTRLTNWAMCVRTGRAGDPPPSRQDWSRPAELAELERHLERFRIAQLDHAGLVRATREAFVLPMCDRDPLPFWSQGRVTLLGDAAHAMYPMGSNGAGRSRSGHRHRRAAGARRLHRHSRRDRSGPARGRGQQLCPRGRWFPGAGQQPGSVTPATGRRSLCCSGERARCCRWV